LDKKLSADYLPTGAELAPYINPNGLVIFRSIGPERYVLNPINKPPYAVLDDDWRIRRRGWRQGYTISKCTVRLDE
jgi:hypothetical protein